MKQKITLLTVLSLIGLNTFAQTQPGNAINFDGLDDYIHTSYDGVSGNNPRSIEAWIKTSTTAVEPHYITD